MMYQKAIMFGDINTAHAILLTGNPKEQKDLGRMVSNYDDAVWSAKRVEVMVEGLFEKFNQNPLLKEALLNTGDTIIVEASPVDRIWGIGLAEDDPRALIETQWLGKNLLGRVLMKVRDDLRKL